MWLKKPKNGAKKTKIMKIVGPYPPNRTSNETDI